MPPPGFLIGAVVQIRKFTGGRWGTIGGYPNTGEMWWGIIIAPCTSSTEKQEPGQQCIYSLQRRKLQITNYDRQHSSKKVTQFTINSTCST